MTKEMCEWTSKHFATPPTKHVIAALVAEITQATGRLQHAGRIAWNVARSVASTLTADEASVRTNWLSHQRDRRSITRMAAEAGDALVMLDEMRGLAVEIQSRGQTLQKEQRQRLDTIKSQETTITAVEEATIIDDDIRRLHVPLLELSTALEDEKVRRPIITTALSRRLGACYTVGVETMVEEIASHLRALREETQKIHARSDVLDDVAQAVVAIIDRSNLPAPPQLTTTWPNWAHDPFAAPTLSRPDVA